MSRRKSKWLTAWLPWQDSMHELFFPSLTKDWAPPERIRIFHGRLHYTIVARFRMPDGHVATCTARCAR